MKIVLGKITESNGDGSYSTRLVVTSELAEKIGDILEEHNPYYEGPTDMAGKMTIEEYLRIYHDEMLDDEEVKALL